MCSPAKAGYPPYLRRLSIDRRRAGIFVVRMAEVPIPGDAAAFPIHTIRHEIEGDA